MEDNSNTSKDDALKKLSLELARAQESRKEAEPKPQANSNGMALGMRMASEFASAIVVGALLGFGFDYWLKSTPFGLMIGLGLGFAAGVLNLVRASREYSEGQPIGRDLPPSQNDEE